MICYYCPICGKCTLGDLAHRCSEKRLKKIERDREAEEENLENEDYELPDFEERFILGADELSRYGR